MPNSQASIFLLPTNEQLAHKSLWIQPRVRMKCFNKLCVCRCVLNTNFLPANSWGDFLGFFFFFFYSLAISHSPKTLFLFFFEILFIWLCQILVGNTYDFYLHWSMWDLVPWKGIEFRPPALGAQAWPLDHQRSPSIPFDISSYRSGILPTLW